MAILPKVRWTNGGSGLAHFALAGVVAFVLIWIGFLLGKLTSDSGKIDLESYRGGVTYVQVRSICLADNSLSKAGCPSWPVSASTLREACQLYTDEGMARLDGYRDTNSFLQGCSDELQGIDDQA